MAGKSRDIAEFGDFQTPGVLALEAMRLVQAAGFGARTIVEPSCGKGAFLIAAAEVFPEASLLGVEINPAYLEEARERLGDHPRFTLMEASFFDVDWESEISRMREPILIVGNPPWVTNAELGTLRSGNLPTKSNFQNLKGFDALTGKSNFDISEWMLLQNLAWLQARNGVMAVLCKTAVARKIVRYAWKNQIRMSDARLYEIDAARHFGAAVDACLFIVAVDGEKSVQECAVYESMTDERPSRTFGFVDGDLVSDVAKYAKVRFLRAGGGPRWRSGIKHDCSKVMEFDRVDGQWLNGFDEKVELEDAFLFPLSKSSDVGGKGIRSRDKFVLVTQRKVGEPTEGIRNIAPKTWAYLEAHESLLGERGSSIYRGKPRFSIFGVGDYSFAPWKVAISGLYKNLNFRLFGPKYNKPMMFDDTVYFLPFLDEGSARAAARLLESEAAQQFLDSMVFWDDKRPVTADLLRRLNMDRLARQAGVEFTYQSDWSEGSLFQAA